MKQIKFLGVALAAMLLLLTSCLGDSGSNSGTDTVYGKVISNMGKLYIQVSGMTIYSDQLMTMDLYEGQWVYTNFAYDFDIPENANWEERGYLIVTISQLAVLNKGYVNSEGVDLETAMENELVLDGAACLGAAYDDLLTIVSFKALTDQKYDFFLIADPNQETEKESEANVYNVYIRGREKGDGGKSPSITHQPHYYFNAKYILDQINRKEKAAGNKAYIIKPHFVSKIDEETNKVEWSAGDKVGVPVIEEEK